MKNLGGRVIVGLRQGRQNALINRHLYTLNPLHPTPTGDSWAGGLEKGIPFSNEIQRKIQIFADGGIRNAEAIRWLDFVRKGVVLKGLAWNWTQIPKQLTGAYAYMFDVPIGDFVKYQAEFLSNIPKAVETMWGIPFIRERFTEGYDRDVKAIVAGLFDRKAGGELAHKSVVMQAIESGMIFAQAGDLGATVIGGYSAYRHGVETCLADLRAQGIDTETEAARRAAHEEGVLFLEQSTERTQTDGSLKGMSSFEAGGSAARLFTTFLSNARTYYQSTYQAAYEWRSGRKGAGKDFARRLFIGHVLLPVIFQATLDALRYPFQDDDEKEKMLQGGNVGSRYAIAMATGSFSGLYVLGQGLASGITSLFDGKVWSRGSNPIADATLSSGKSINKLMDEALGDGIDPLEIADVAGDILAAYGTLAKQDALAFPIAERVGKSFGLDNMLSEMMQPEGIREGKQADKRWKKLSDEFRAMPKEQRIENLKARLKAGEITRIEAQSLASLKAKSEKPPKEIAALMRLGTSSGARAVAMAKQLQGMDDLEIERQVQAWGEWDGLLTPSVMARLETETGRRLRP
jgi:hypothetical protein